ncbi:uncharacterized protein LOC133459260 [Cololabis saira]|uniref:uncharacterized protein LOC133459260 n=1 Tax=Cololabis saira TaxID=129043 RepID=UPI002AD58BEC|nr:uncharacterized protein LOC133459260 [Cololabis saira]
MERRKNSRDFQEHFVRNEHLNLDRLKEVARARRLENQYLYKENIPESPHPEFNMAYLTHDTNKWALRGIRRDEGFRDPSEDPNNPFNGSLVWWSLAMGPEEIQSAETRFLEKTFPERTEEQAAAQQSFLSMFTTSPAFEKTSRLGSYRFTFPLEEVLGAYREQFCGDKEPIMRIYETVLYKQEVVHVVLVHSPDNQDFTNYPEVPNDDPNAICVFKDGTFIWRPEAMSETHGYKLVYRRDVNQVEVKDVDFPEFYIWDHVAVALHLEEGQVLKFDLEKLRNNIKYCAKASVTYGKAPHDIFEFAEKAVKELWPDVDLPLERQ